MEAAANGPDPLIGLGLAYVEFALQKRGLFRLMFGPILVERAKYPALNEAANAAFDCVQRIASGAEGGRQEDNAASMAAWGLVHGLSALFIDGLVPEARARGLAEEILQAERNPNTGPPPEWRVAERRTSLRGSRVPQLGRPCPAHLPRPAFRPLARSARRGVALRRSSGGSVTPSVPRHRSGDDLDPSDRLRRRRRAGRARAGGIPADLSPPGLGRARSPSRSGRAPSRPRARRCGAPHASRASVAAIGVANQRETALIWERSTGQPIANAIVWQDRRTAESAPR